MRASEWAVGSIRLSLARLDPSRAPPGPCARGSWHRAPRSRRRAHGRGHVCARPCSARGGPSLLTVTGHRAHRRGHARTGMGTVRTDAAMRARVWAPRARRLGAKYNEFYHVMV
ncbi:hypothetical protein TorRG33x02_015770 [Trema orientale]|uniref:Uncharacterized protein n=1 Tax=Trema orientale TaxID=63057 RepID=A0A2P5FXR4_TREOI|nr:hypothetical protein TorRG33x02_015770 [Trema orientale]